jgi:hypothetical protein
MIGSMTRKMACGVILAASALLGGVSVATAADQTLVLPAGIACEDFGLRIEITGGNQVMRTFTDENGNPVRFLRPAEARRSPSRTCRRAPRSRCNRTGP